MNKLKCDSRLPTVETKTYQDCRDIYFELPEKGLVIDEYILYVSLYQDGFTSVNDKSSPEAVCIKISGMPTDLFREYVYSPICFVFSGYDFATVIKTYVDFESTMGKNGLYLRVNKNEFVHLRYSIEAVDGDTVAQFKMERAGGNNSNCPCFLDCYRKRLNSIMFSLFPVHSVIAPPSATITTIPVTVLPENDEGVASLCNTISMMIKFGSPDIENYVYSIIGNENSGYIAKANNLMKIIKKLSFSEAFAWMPSFLNENYNSIKIISELTERFSYLDNGCITSVLNSITETRNNTIYMKRDHRLLLDYKSPRERLAYQLVGYDCMENNNPISKIHPLQNLCICDGKKYIIDVMHLYALFLEWIVDLIRDFTVSSKEYDEFYKKTIKGFFKVETDQERLKERLEEIKSTTFLSDRVFKSAEKRLKEIIWINGKKLSWLNEKLLEKNRHNSKRIYSFQGEKSSVDNLSCHDKLILLLCILESLLIDSLGHPIIYSIVQIIRCLSTLYAFHNSDIQGMFLTNYRLCFYLDRITSVIPPKRLTPTIHRLSHVFSSLICSGNLKFHDNFRMENQFQFCKKMMGSLNSNPVVTVNNRLLTFTYCNVISEVDNHKPLHSKPVRTRINNPVQSILDSVPLDLIILHCYLDDLLYLESDDSTNQSIIDTVHSFGMDFDGSEDERTFSLSLKHLLSLFGKTENDFKLERQLLLYKLIRLVSDDTGTVTYSSMDDSVINQQQITMHTLKEPIPSREYPDYNSGLGYTLLADNSIQCYVVVGYLKAKVNGDDYPVAVCFPLDAESTFLQMSYHRITVKKKFRCDRVAFLSLNRLHVNESLISPSIKSDCFELMLLTLYLTQSKGVRGIKRGKAENHYYLRERNQQVYYQEVLEDNREKTQYIKHLEACLQSYMKQNTYGNTIAV